MAKQVMFYEKAVPINSKHHKKWSIERSNTFGFAREVNAVPLMAVEFASAAAEYIIVFAGKDNAFIPMVLLGLRDAENLYLTKEQTWDAKYIPAFVRRYPFVFASSPDGGNNTFTLCIDEDYSGSNSSSWRRAAGWNCCTCICTRCATSERWRLAPAPRQSAAELSSLRKYETNVLIHEKAGIRLPQNLLAQGSG